MPAGPAEIACPELTSLLGEALASGACPAIISREITLDDRIHMVSAGPVFEAEQRVNVERSEFCPLELVASALGA